MNTQLVQTHASSSEFLAIIDRAARDPSVDVEKLQRLLDIREIELNRANDRAFNSALVLAQGEMRPINANANNPQTRSRYATYAALDAECRPLYAKHGLGPSFNTEPTGDPNMLRVVCMLGHISGATRRYQIDMPIDTKGARGGDVMTRTHATGSAYTYGKRYLLIGMFNLSIDDDDDGNAAARRTPTINRNLQPMRQQYGSDPIDEPAPAEHVEPYLIEMTEGSTWAQFLEPLQRCILQAKTVTEVDQWKLLNQDMLLKLKEAKPQLHKLFEKNIEPKILELEQAG
jgi:ERF superfamily